MRNHNIRFTSLAAIILALPLLGVCSDESNATTTAPLSPAVIAQQHEDVIARVGEEEINYSLIKLAYV